MIDQQNVERAAERFRLPEGSFERLALRRDRKRRNQRIRAGVFGIAIAIALGWLSVNAIRSAPVPAVPPEPAVDLGIFAPVAGQIVYGDRQGIWGVDPTAPAGSAAPVQLTSDPATPLGWSSDGTELLIVRTTPRPDPLEVLSILHADGTESELATSPMFNAWDGATISPDGARVVFVGPKTLYAVDVDTGTTEVLLRSPEGDLTTPTFSPDGTQIAYVDGSGDHDFHVWVMNADGSDPHEIVFNERTAAGDHVRGMAWSPAGDRIALGFDVGIYTFAPDGSAFTQVISDGTSPYWSPDGSRIAYTIGWPDPQHVAWAIADADGSNDRAFDFGASGPWHPGKNTATELLPTDDVSPTPGPSALAYGVDGDVFLADADGSNAVRIADGVPVDGADECAPGEERAEYAVFGTAWSPDGRYLAYWDWGCPVPPGAWGTVLISDAEGNVIATFPGQGWTISWSPDSTRIAVMDVWGGGDATIGVYGLDGTRQAALTVPSALTPPGDYSPVWSRDPASLLLPGVQVPLDGDAPTPFPLEFAWFGVYSPDGSRVAYVDRRSLVVEGADGPDAQEPGGPGEFWSVAWSPNGDLVAFAADGTGLLVRDVATGADTSLVDVTRSERLSVIEFSPDGERILFTRSDADGGRSSLWSIGLDGRDLRRLVDGIDWADLQPQGRPS